VLVVAALRPLLAELVFEHGEALLWTAVVAFLVVLLTEAGLWLGLGGR